MKTPSSKILRSFAFAIIVVAASFAFAFAAPANPAAAASCHNKMWLKAHAEYTFAEHRNWLDATAPYNGSVPYVIVDARTGEAHSSSEWQYWGGHFYVNTRYAWTHPWWGGEPWLLLYNCY